MSPRAETHVVIVGGGVAGLSCAWRLAADPELGMATPTAAADPALPLATLHGRRARLRVTVLEATGRLGGNIRSQHDQGFVLEWGPNGFLDNAPETPRICRLLGVEDRLLPASDAAARRFLYVRGRLRPLPMSPAAFLMGDVLTLRGRLRVLAEPFLPGRPDPEESVFSFAARRIGEEAARTLVDAMVSGVYGGNARDLSLPAAFPKLYDLEREHGGLVRGMIALMRRRRRERREAAARAAADTGTAVGKDAGMDAGKTVRKAKGSGPAGPGGVLTSFDDGLEVFIQLLERALRASGRVEILMGASVSGLRPPAGPGAAGRTAAGPAPDPASQGPAGRWQIALEDGRSLPADAVILALPARRAAGLCHPFDPDLAGTLRTIPEAPMAVVALAYRSAELPQPLDGFGFLIPRGEGPRILGVLWDSCIYPGRAREGYTLVRAMLGGAHDPKAMELSDEEILAQVRRDLHTTMGLDLTPSHSWIIRHPAGIPQYTLGHMDRLRAIDRGKDRWPGLAFAGNSYRGISINHCVESSIPIARSILRGLPA